MSIFSKLKHQQAIKHLSQSDEYSFFLSNRKLLIENNCFLPLYNVENDFNLMKANIIIRSLQNKTEIEQRLYVLAEQSIGISGRIKHHDIRSQMEGAYDGLIFLEEENHHYFVPIFNRAMNYVYAHEADKLLDFPYNKLKNEFSTSIIDPFETYNFSLFDSYFTKLIRLTGDKTSMGFYSVDYKTIYIINKQGRLDVKIPLFDRKLKNPDFEKIPERVIPVLEAFFANDRKLFLDRLYSSKLISFHVYQSLINRRKGHRLIIRET